MAEIHPVTMPTWGMSMTEGKIVGWSASEGDRIEAGDELVEIETTKLTGTLEAHDGGGTLRRIIGEVGTVYPVGALIGVIASEDASEADVDAFVAGYVVEVVGEGSEGGPREEIVDLGGVAINVISTPEVTGMAPILLIHGFGGEAGNWALTQSALAGTRRVIAVDLPGHGKSAKIMPGPTPEGFASLLAGVIAHLGIERLHVAGHSYGGLVASMLAARLGARALSLALVDPAGLSSERGADYLNRFVAAQDRKALKDVMSLLFADSSLVSRSMVAGMLDYRRIEGVQETLTAIAADYTARSGSFGSLPEALAKRTLVVWGEKDAIFPAAQIDLLAPVAQKHVVDGAGHMPHVESSAFNRILSDFVARFDG